MDPSPPLDDVAEVVLRANPAYELVVVDHLTPDQSRQLGHTEADPDYYGVLQPAAGTTLAPKAVGHDVALLFLTLRQPGHLPDYFRRRLGADGSGAIAELVLDGILEVEGPTGFHSGPEALRHVRTQHTDASPAGPLARLSVDALKYAQSLKLADPLQLAIRLYSFNRVPIAVRWRNRWPSPEAVAADLGVDAGGRNQTRLSRHWSRAVHDDTAGGWLSWRTRRHRPPGRSGVPAYKLYVSPDCSEVAAAFDEMVGALAATPALAFKVGCDAPGLLRPDKMVIYFAGSDELATGAQRLRQALQGHRAHGVPFTAQFGHDALLSWGMDPPETASDPVFRGRASWRFWLTQRLARALVQAQAAPAEGIEPWSFALERLRLDGVNPETWAPNSTIWARYILGGD